MREGLFALAGAVVVAGLALAASGRFEPQGIDNQIGVFVVDRWTGTTRLCATSCRVID